MAVRLEPAASRSRVKHSTTEPPINVFTLSIWENFRWGLLYFDQSAYIANPRKSANSAYSLQDSDTLCRLLIQTV